AALVDELPAAVSAKLFSGLSEKERELTAPMLGYPASAIGRHMSTEYIRVRPETTALEALEQVRLHGKDAETVYLLLVTGPTRRLEGVAGLRDVLLADPDTPIGDVMSEPEYVSGSEDAEVAARRAVRTSHLVVPVVDDERRL